MKITTEAYRKAMASTIREPTEVEITFRNIDTGAALDGKWTGNGEMPWSETETLDADSPYGNTVYTCEPNRCLLDGSFKFLDQSSHAEKDGFVSNKLARPKQGGNTPKSGLFFSGAVAYSYDPYETGEIGDTIVILDRKFASPKTFPGITIEFDTRTGEWPSGISISYFKRGKQAGQATVAVTSAVAVVDLPALNVDSVKISAWGLVYARRMRVERILFGIERVFTNNEITELTQSHDVDPMSRRAPKEKFSFSIIDNEQEYNIENPKGIWKYVDAKSPVRVRFGIHTGGDRIEWTKEDRYNLSGKPASKNRIVRFNSSSILGSIEGTYYKDTAGRKSLYSLAESVLTDANIIQGRRGENPWYIDESLREIYTDGILPVDSYVRCLQIIAHAGCCRLYTDDSNIIRIERVSTYQYQDSGFVLDYNSIMENSQVASRIPTLRSVDVKKFSYTPDEKESVLYDGETKDSLVHVEFSAAQNVRIEVSGGSVSRSSIYAQAADIEFTSGTKKFKVIGNPINVSNTVLSYSLRETGEVDTEENPLITSDETAYTLARHFASYLGYRTTYDMDYRGNPELEVGDVVRLQTQFAENVPALILCDEIRFNGALHGTVKAKSLGGEA